MVPPRRTTGSTDNQAVTPELEGRILAFLNLVTDPAEIAERIRPYVGCTLPLYVAKQILEARDRRRFTSLDQVAAVLGVAPRTLDVIIANAISSRAVTPELEDRILAFLNRVKDPAEIADRIRPYVERALPMYVAKRILKARDRQCFTSLDQVATALGVDPRILEKSITAIFEDLDTTVSDQYPILLFPVRASFHSA